MIPYGNLYFFYILLLALLPAIILGLLGKPIRKYGMFVNLLFILWLFSDSSKTLSELVLFYVGELILVVSYLYIRRRYTQRWILWITIVFSLLPLLLVKYGDTVFHRHITLLGISYLTFKVIQVLIETYDGLIKKINILDFTYFLLFFPTISSGPIDRSRRFINDLDKPVSSVEYQDLLRTGIYKLFNGLAYKFIIGSLIYNYWLVKIPETHTFMNTMNYMYAYSFYLFFDFAGYSRIAIGTSYILGIKTPENFNLPFLSRDIKDFWNRWHMTLSFWFRDYLYTRFVMASLKNKWFKSRHTSSYIGFMITMTTMGIWHGTQFYYVLYGIYHGLLIITTDFIERKSKWYKKALKSNGWNVVFTFITFNLVCFGFLLFSGYIFMK